MVKIRLTRIGKKKRSVYRVVVMDSKAPRDGKSIEEVGFYDPQSHEFRYKEDRVKLWTDRGAQKTKRVAHLIAKATGATAEIRTSQNQNIAKKDRVKQEA